MAHKKGLGSSKNGRDSNAQRLGVKAFAGQLVVADGYETAIAAALGAAAEAVDRHGTGT